MKPAELIPLVDALLDHLDGLREEGCRELEVGTPRPAAETVAPETDAGEASGRALCMLPARRMAACGDGTQALLLVGEPSLAAAEGREVLDKVLHALGFEAEAAEPWQAAAAAERAPEALVTFGAGAFAELTGSDQSLSSARGVWRREAASGIPLLPVFDPVLLGEDRQAKQAVWQDLLGVLKRLELDLPEWSRKFAR